MKKAFTFVLFLFILSACGRVDQKTVDVATPTTNVTLTAVPNVINENDRLRLCMVGEPNSIYLYDPINVTARKALAIIYDGIVPTQARLFKTSILDGFPTFEGGGAAVVPIKVKQGDRVVTFDETAKTLEPGDRVFPSGCRDLNCVVTFNGEPIVMDQVVVNFTFLPDLHWSDGESMTAEDSIFSSELAKKSSAPNIRALIDRTASYELVSDDVIQWWGVPGFLSVEPSAVFFAPFPQHLHPSSVPIDLEKNAMSDALLAGWGAYKFERWVNGEMIFSPNPYFFDPDGKKAKFKELVLKFYPTADDAYEGFLNRSCDIVDRGSGFEKFTPILSDLAASGQINMQITKSPLIETLVYNVRNGDDQGSDIYRPLSNPLTRAAISNCIDRYALGNYDLRGYPVITDSFLVPYDLPIDEIWLPFSRSMSEAKEYFERSGWTDNDNDPTTPRVSKNISGVKDGTKLILDYAVVNTPLRVGMADTISKMLMDCGVGVQTKIVEAEQYFAASSNGTLASADFDIAQFAFGSYEIDPPCEVFSSMEIPQLSNGWQGVNYSGYINRDYDYACLNSRASRIDKVEWTRWLKFAHEYLLNGGPAFPLFHQYQITAAQVDICIPLIDENDPLGYVNIVDFARATECRSTP